MMRIDLAGWTREATQGDPRAFFALFDEADRLGFDGVWFSEFRLPTADWPYPSPLLLAAALLARTERLRVGTSVLVLPLHQPLLLADEVAQLAFQSGGRIDIGVGRGTEPATLAALNIDAAQTRARFERNCIVLQAQAAHVPLYVAGSTPETLGFAIERDLPLLLSLEPPETTQLGHVADILQGRPSTLLRRSSLARYVCIGTDAASVQSQLDGLWAQLQARREFFAARRGVPPEQVPRIEPERMLREQFIHGDPAQCHAQILALRARSGIDALRCVFNANGLLDNTQALAGMTLFAIEVLPALREPA
ncbi:MULTISPECIES: LLM class flavin-dependent oxidoreductase [unclassified Variovorax]|uniref:LLM class flavin-dependent oxidoreductase n=1 Tax=unclassified Variovorax TaxID=663243 RepID=UPI002576721A|nr:MULTISPECIES: LLM class flavin-dependent oxidoreductase [unclassified Variovorax]MDM0089022.1 LLM class flavin-dependent oxidoreductase [Variovorax sp. J22G40]MDM0147095.1 LLM class flavin-dependent oxidoreductase [Variovorax sp. J2P1-31]